MNLSCTLPFTEERSSTMKTYTIFLYSSDSLFIKFYLSIDNSVLTHVEGRTEHSPLNSQYVQTGVLE